MPNRDSRDIDTEHRLTELEAFKEYAEKEIPVLEEEIKSLEEKVAYYDRMALKFGGFAMGALCLSALISMKFDQVREIITHWLAK